LEDNTRPGLRERTLWVFGPRTSHAWTGDGVRRAEVVVVHLASVPRPLQRAAATNGYVQAALSARDCAALTDMRLQLSNELLNPNQLSEVVIQRAQAELTLLALREAERQPLPIGPSRERSLVDAAVGYFEEHLEETPSVDQVARQLGLSATHLRRVFSRVLQRSPREIFDEIRIQRAMSLLNQTDAGVEHIARQCGFSQASALSRAFLRHTGVSPGRWRRAYDLPTSRSSLLQLGWRR
jgi:AraC family transcriptional regulator